MILLDADILLELLLPGRLRKARVRQYLQETTETPVITMLSVHLVLHFGLREKIDIADLQTFLSSYEKVSMLSADYDEAMRLLKDRDHEDTLQLAAARRAGCTKIVTLDKKFAETYHDKIAFQVL
ncbi:MAG: PIN domain-containing protein [Candidatus Saccharimonadales bacterium]|jgi:predicted nucleic acid-binding protein